ncbi:MAG: ribokinase [candidate division KSB1 bacterium]|nr:ribokinase [candidate division KSB1 bacterium]
MMNIVVVGSSNTDMIVQVPRIPKPGETILGGKFSTAAGGKGANQAVAAARAGGQVAFVTRVGMDMFGEKALEGFKKDNLNIDYVFKDPDAPSGIAEIFVAKDGENSIAVASGANANLSPLDIKKAESVIADAGILVMQLEIPIETVVAAAKLAKSHGVDIILNPAPAQPLSDELLSLITILTPNESEAELLTGVAVQDEPSAKQAADILHQKGVSTVVITMGARGAYVSDASFSGMIPAKSVKAVDATAAGDVYNGALAVALSEKKQLSDAVVFANTAAALSVTKLGAQPSAPFKNEILKFLGV